MPGSDRRQVQMVRSCFERFANPNGALAYLEDIRLRLAFNRTVKTVERALLDLSELVGAEGSRPDEETGEGPDGLWLWSDLNLVIEAKTERASSLPKKDGGQLLQSLNWFGRNYPTRGEATPLVVASKARADKRTDFPEGTRVLTGDGVSKLLDNLKCFLEELVAEPGLARDESRLADRLQHYALSPERFLGTYTVKLT